MHSRSDGIGPHGKSSNLPVKVNKKRPSMAPKGQVRSCVTSRIPGSHDKVRQRRSFPTDYCGLMRKLHANVPQTLLRGVTEENTQKKRENPGLGKVKIMLRVSRDHSTAQSSDKEFLRVEGNKKHVSVFVPDDQSSRTNASAPKVYAFDSVFTEDTPQNDICSASLVDVIQAVLQGADGTVFCYGQSNIGKTYVLLGRDRSPNDVGVLPCAINWLYKCISELREQQGRRLSVRVSATEVYGRSEKLRDLLAGYCEDGPSAALCVNEDPLLGTQLQNQCEIRANTAERAAYLLDAALASRSCSGSRNTADARRHSHMVYTLHIYHHKLDKGDSGVTGGRSRLHFIDLGSCEKTLVKTTNSLALSLSSLGHVIMAIVNNSKHVPFRESKLTCVLRESLGNVNCRVVMLAHVSRDVMHYPDTLSTIQMASRIHRVLKKKNKSSSFGDNARNYGVDSRLQRSKHLRHKTRDDESVGSSSGMECTSGSELSCDTVVYVNPNGVPMSDRELTDNEGPPEMVPIRMKPNIPPIISEASPPEEGEMVYNIAQAKVHKLGSQEAISPTSQSGHNLSTQSKSQINNLNRAAKSGSQKASKIAKPDSKLPRHSSTKNSSQRPERSNIRKPSTPTANSSLKSPSCNATSNKTSSAKTSASKKKQNQIYQPKTQQNKTSTQLSERRNHIKPVATTMENSNKKQIRPPGPVSNSSQGQSLQSQISQPSARLTRPNTTSKGTAHTPTSISESTRKEEKAQKPLAKNNKRNIAPPIPQRTSSQKKRTHDYVNVKNGRVDIPDYENVPIYNVQNPPHLQQKSAALTTPVHVSNQCYEDVLIPSVQKYTEELRTHSALDYRDQYSPYENVIMPDYPTPQDERPDPVGCAFDSSEKLKQSSRSDATRSSTPAGRINPQSVDIRPDSLFVNLDDEDWVSPDDEDSDAVDVNFYCLTFTTRNPLVPMSRRKFSQQIKDNKKRKTSFDISDSDQSANLHQIVAENGGMTNQQHGQVRNGINVQNASVPENTSTSPLTRGDTFIIDDASQERWAWEVHDPEIGDSFPEDAPNDEGSEGDADFDISQLKEMPKLKCSYASETERSGSEMENGSQNSSNCDMYRGDLSGVSAHSLANFNQITRTPSMTSGGHREVCLYDSNSLEMSYVSTKPMLQSSFSSPSRSSNSTQSPGKRAIKKDSAVRRRTSKPVVITKSTSKEGARLTLVKKHSSGGPTLELLITKEDEKERNKSASPNNTQNYRERKYGISTDGKSTENESKKIQNGHSQNSKKSKWSGLRRFSSKKSETKSERPVTNNTEPNSGKTSIVSKILTPKGKPKNSSNAHGKLKTDAGNATTQQEPDLINAGHNGNTQTRMNLPFNSKAKPQNTKQSNLQKTSQNSTRTNQTNSTTNKSSLVAKRKESVKNSSGSPSSRFGFSRKSKAK